MSLGDGPISRRVVREAIALGLAAGMPTAQAVYNHQKTAFDGQSPVVRILSVGSERPSMTERGIRSKLMFLVQVWVLFTPSGAWSEADAENALDQLELELISWIVANQQTELWTGLRYERRSLVETVKVAGDVYLVEDVMIQADVYG